MIYTDTQNNYRGYCNCCYEKIGYCRELYEN